MWRQRVYRGCLISGLLLVMCCASVVGLATELSTELSAELVAYPSEIRLETPGAQQRLVVERVRDGLAIGDVTDAMEWTIQRPETARYRDRYVEPLGNGRTVLIGRMASEQGKPGGEVRVPVVVRGQQQPPMWEFRRHVLPILSKRGCNTGACHGALSGKGGMKLSLRGYNPEGDFRVIAQEAGGRRIELADPAHSLLLLKPTTAVPHKGGHRFDTGSRDYRILARWIADGAAAPQAADPRLESLNVQPRQAQLHPGDQQRLVVTATYSDGRREDVTTWARFSSADETVAKVDADGNVHVVGHGQGAIVVWFSSRIQLAQILSPYSNDVDARVFARAPRRNFIDELVLQKLAQLNLAPSPPSDDADFLRRVYLDTIGTLPTAEEVVAFLDDPRSDKRDRTIDSLLSRPEFVDYWAYKWSDLLLVNGRRLRPKAVHAYYGWIREHVEQNTPWDEFVRQVITAKGSNVENGATNFYALHQEPESMSENVCQAFLSLSIGCAKCHNHPLEKWTNDQYYGMANFFARVRAKGWGGDARSGDGVRTLFVADEGDLIQPLTGKPQVPTPLDGNPLASDAAVRDRREYLAQWLTSPENRYFSRAISNRIWAHFLGRGIVEPVDDLRVSNPPRHEPLLDALATFLVEHDFDLKLLMREILQSETYQRSSSPIEQNKDDRHFFSRYYPRRLPAEVLLDAISQVTAVPTRFTHIGYDGNDFVKTDDYPVGTRAIQLHDSAVVSDFLKTFGRNERDITCECERSNTPSMVQVLHISNGKTINERLKEPTSCVADAMELGDDFPAIVRQAFLDTLSRYPTEEESDRFCTLLRTTFEQERRLVIEDLYWSLMSTREFLFHH